MHEQRRGDWKQTFTGRAFWPLDPRADEVHLSDISHALSLVCRFGGHCRTFYSVAQHSVHVADEAARLCADADRRPLAALVGLLHDAAEAYVGDMIRPVKHLAELEAYRAIEDRIQEVIFESVGIAADVWRVMPFVKAADNAVLATEKRDLMGPAPRAWGELPPPLPTTIVPWSAAEAEEKFVRRFYYLHTYHQGGAA